MSPILAEIPHMASYPSDYPAEFMDLRTRGFEKDIRICLRKYQAKFFRQRKATHAYFPALMTCLSFCEFLSGLNAGNITASGRTSITQVENFAHDYLDMTTYSPLIINILWEGFRNKISHLAHPYFVFDTSNISTGKLRHTNMRITWSVSEADRDRHLELEQRSGHVRKQLVPIDVPFNRMLHISLPTFRDDLIKAAKQYTSHMLVDRTKRANFEMSLDVMFAI